MRWWISHITLTAILGVSVNIAYAQPKSNPLVPKPSTDAFSKAFMYVYEDASMAFMNVKGRKLSNGLMEYFECKKTLPGAFAGFISNHDKPVCLYDFGSFKTLDNAEQSMRSISVKVANAFRQTALVKYIDSTEDTSLVKRTALAEMINGGFYTKDDKMPAQYPSVVISVDDLKKSMAEVTKAGGKVIGEPMEIKGYGMQVSFSDTEGNRVSMLEPTIEMKAKTE